MAGAGDAGEGSVERAPVVVGVMGRSGTGKTSLLESLVPAVQTFDLRVGVIKHTSHGFLADRPGKDSYRLYEAGAEAVALVSRQQLATFTRRSPDEGPGAPLAMALASLPPDLDLVLAEGFSWESIPRLVLVPGSEQPLAEHTRGGEVLELVRVPKPVSGRKPVFEPALLESLTALLRGLVEGRAR